MPVFCRGLPSVDEALKGKSSASFLEAKLFSELDAVFSAASLLSSGVLLTLARTTTLRPGQELLHAVR